MNCASEPAVYCGSHFNFEVLALKWEVGLHSQNVWTFELPPFQQQPLTESRKKDGLFIFTLSKARMSCPRREIVETDASVVEKEEFSSWAAR